MTNDESVLREVDRAVAEDRQWAVLRKNGPALIAGAVLIVGAVAGWQVWQTQTASRAKETALQFSTAADTLRTSPEDGRAALEAVAAEAPEGYAALANMRRAGSLGSTGDRAGALAAYRSVYNDGGAPQRLRELARLRAASLSMAEGRDAVLSDLGSLTESDGPFGPYARELAALAALDAKDYEAAEAMFARAAADEAAPAPVRQRAEEFAALAESAKSGVNITGEARVDDLMKALETPVQDSHEGHDHAEPEEAGAPDSTVEAGPAPDSQESPDAAPNSDGAASQDQ